MHAERYFEDLTVGDLFVFGEANMAPSEMMCFARRFDPQPFHLDPNEAAKTSVGGLIASGWMTASVAMRLLCDAAPFGSTPFLGRGVDELRWPAPVRPDDILTGTAEVIEMRPSASRQDRGTVRMRLVLRNQRGATVFSMVPSMVVPTRPKGQEV